MRSGYKHQLIEEQTKKSYKPKRVPVQRERPITIDLPDATTTAGVNALQAAISASVSRGDLVLAEGAVLAGSIGYGGAEFVDLVDQMGNWASLPARIVKPHEVWSCINAYGQKRITDGLNSRYFCILPSRASYLIGSAHY